MPQARNLIATAAPTRASAKLLTDTFDAVWASIGPTFAGRKSETDDARMALARSVLDFYRAGITEPEPLRRLCLRSMRLSQDFILH